MRRWRRWFADATVKIAATPTQHRISRWQGMRNAARVVAQRHEFLAAASAARSGLGLTQLAPRERRARVEARERRGFHGLRAELPCRSA